MPEITIEQLDAKQTELAQLIDKEPWIADCVSWGE